MADENWKQHSRTSRFTRELEINAVSGAAPRKWEQSKRHANKRVPAQIGHGRIQSAVINFYDRTQYCTGRFVQRYFLGGPPSIHLHLGEPPNLGTHLVNPILTNIVFSYIVFSSPHLKVRL